MRFIFALFVALLCSTSVAHAQEDAADGGPAYSFDDYAELESAIEEADILRLASEPGSDARRLATERAIEARRYLLEYLTGWIAEGTLNGEMETYARQARLVVVENLLHLYVEIEECREAEQALILIDGFEASEDEEFQAAYQAAGDAVTGCQSDETNSHSSVGDPDADASSGEYDEQAPGVGEPPGRSGRRNVGVAITSVGASAFLAGWIWDLTLLDDRREFIDARQACSRSVSDPECTSSEELDTSLRSARGPVIGLIAGGAALGALGVTLILTDNEGEASERTTWEVDLSPNGARATFRWGGRP